MPTRSASAWTPHAGVTELMQRLIRLEISILNFIVMMTAWEGRGARLMQVSAVLHRAWSPCGGAARSTKGAVRAVSISATL